MNYKILTPTTERKKNQKNEKSVYGIITPEWQLDEIILPEKTGDTLDDIVSFCTNKETIVNEWDLKRFLKGKGGTTAINFFGIPGTGKSITAEALAHAMGKKIIRSDYSEISGSLFGQTEKNLTKLFEKAEEHDALLFFDEADGLLCKRSSNSQYGENKNQIKSHLLQLMDRSNIMIVFATNLFENYDKAFFRRILFHVEFKAPNYAQRRDLWKFHLSEQVPKSVTYKKIAELTPNLAGGDIKNIALKLCIKLSRGKLKEIDEASVKNEVERYRNALEASTRNMTIKPTENGLKNSNHITKTE